MHPAKQIRFSRNRRRSSFVFELLQVVDRVDPLQAEPGLALDRRDVVDRRERLRPLRRIRHVRVQQRQVELHVQRLLVELPRQVHPRLGRVDVLVEVQHQVVPHDRVARREERHQPVDQVPLRVRHLAAQVHQVRGEVHLLHRPRVLDGVPVHLEEDRIGHRAQREVHPGVQQHRRHPLKSNRRKGRKGRPSRFRGTPRVSLEGQGSAGLLAGLAHLGVLQRAGHRLGLRVHGDLGRGRHRGSGVGAAAGAALATGMFGVEVMLAPAGVPTVALAIRVAGRERR